MGWAAGMAAGPAEGLAAQRPPEERGIGRDVDGRERAVLVGADLRHPGGRGRGDQAVQARDAGATLGADASLAELEELARTAGAEVVGRLKQKLDHPDPATFLGR